VTFLLAAAVPAAVAAVLLVVGGRDATLKDAEPLPS
jgi:hypothetical protein